MFLGRPPRNKEVPSSPVVPVGDDLSENSLELVIKCLNKQNSQNQKLFNLVTELDSKVQEQNKTIETLQQSITVPFHESRLNWVPDPAPSPPRRMERAVTLPPSGSSANSSDSSISVPSDTRAPISSDSTRSHTKPVSVRETSENEAFTIATHGPSGALLSPALPKKCRRRRRRQSRRAANRNSAACSAAPVTQDERWANQRTASHAGATQLQLEDSNPTSSKRTAVYPPSRIVGNSAANENSPVQLGLELGRFPGLYKPAVPDQQQDTTARTLRVKN